MRNRDYWRALYDEARDAFVVEQAGWVDSEPQIEYRFTYFSVDEDEEIARMGGLDKWWLNEEGFVEGDFFAFGKYLDHTAFDTEVERILQEAQKRTKDDNIDFFLAVIDVVKERAVESELGDESIFDFDGLFELGSEDAYSRRPYSSDRLHDHVVRTKDECWRLYVARVVDLKHKPLGWCLCVVLYPSLTSDATKEEMDAAEVAHILELNHFHTYSEAVVAINGTLQFMTEDGRVEDPEYAFMNDSDVFELMSIQGSIEGIVAPTWDILEGDVLRRFLTGTQPLARSARRWHPRQEDAVARVAEAMKLPLHVVDQLYARMLDSMRIVEPLEENSPWRAFDDAE